MNVKPVKGSRIDQRSKVEESDQHMGNGSHPRSYQKAKTERVDAFLESNAGVSRRQARKRTK